MACRSWLYWSSVACVGSSVPVVGGGRAGCAFVGLGGPSAGLVGEASLVIESVWQVLMAGSEVGDGGGPAINVSAKRIS
jgi:hypothetical protein